MATDQLIYSSGMSTPWGPAHYGTQYAQGLISVGTAGHGGFMVTDEFLQRNVASGKQRELIRSHGIEHYPRGRSTPRYCYEEDLDWAIVTLGVPHLWSRLFIVKPKEDNTLQPYMRSQPPTDVAERVTDLPEVEREAILQYLIQTLSATYPNFVEAMGYTPDPEGYCIYEERQERDRQREANDPDLIVAATKINDDETRVWTADGTGHVVTTDSYVSKHRKNWRLINLSDCDLIRHEEGGDTTG